MSVNVFLYRMLLINKKHSKSIFTLVPFLTLLKVLEGLESLHHYTTCKMFLLLTWLSLFDGDGQNKRTLTSMSACETLKHQQRALWDAEPAPVGLHGVLVGTNE